MIPRWLRACLSTTVVILLITGHAVSLAQSGEPSPIVVVLVVPSRAGPGELIDVAVQYKVIDPNATAVLNYNLFGPAHIRTRSPEPPNPILNTWGPKFDPIEGTITIQVQVDEGTDGETLYHEFEVAWGNKKASFSGGTQIEFVPPTPTPSPTPRPRPVSSPTPTPTSAPSAAPPSVRLDSASFVGGAGALPLASVESDEPVGLAIQYTSSLDLTGAVLRIRFIPDIVVLEGFERQGATLARTLPDLPQTTSAALPGSPFLGRLLGPGNPAFRSTRGIAQLALGRVDDAIAELQAAVDAGLDSQGPAAMAENYYHLARAWEARGETAYARDHYLKSVNMGPDTLFGRRSAEKLQEQHSLWPERR